MLSTFLIACLLAALTVCIHAAGIALMLRHWTRLGAQPPISLLHYCMDAAGHDLVELILLHLTEISLWALFKQARSACPTPNSAFYFSGVVTTDRLRRSLVLAQAMATPRTARGPRRRPHVRLVHGLFLRPRKPHSSTAANESWGRIRHRREIIDRARIVLTGPGAEVQLLSCEAPRCAHDTTVPAPNRICDRIVDRVPGKNYLPELSAKNYLEDDAVPAPGD